MFDSGFARIATGIAVAAWLVGALLYANPAAGAEGCPPVTTQETLSLRVRLADSDLERGDKAKFFVSVRRDASRAIGDVGGKRNAAAGMPVEGAELLIGLASGDSSLYGRGLTDESGRAVIDFRIQRYLETGSATLHAYAWVDHARTPCNMNPREWGEKHEAGFAKIS